MPTQTHRQPLRRFLQPYRGSLSLATGLILVETLLDLARPWPLKLAVSHRLSLAARADRVVVLDGGRVVEQGPLPATCWPPAAPTPACGPLQHPAELAMSGNSGEGVSS